MTTITELAELCGILVADIGDDTIRALVANGMIENEYILRVWDDGSSEELNCEEGDDYAELARDYMADGDWEGPAAIDYSWEVTDLTGDVIDNGSDTLEIEADEEELMKKAGADEDCEHEWTSEGEGGCMENPGVWSLGGTAMMFRSHCIHCGLIKTEHHCGSQRNPGDCDTVSFEMPDHVEED